MILKLECSDKKELWRLLFLKMKNSYVWIGFVSLHNWRHLKVSTMCRPCLISRKMTSFALPLSKPLLLRRLGIQKSLGSPCSKVGGMLGFIRLVKQESASLRFHSPLEVSPFSLKRIRLQRVLLNLQPHPHLLKWPPLKLLNRLLLKLKLLERKLMQISSKLRCPTKKDMVPLTSLLFTLDWRINISMGQIPKMIPTWKW